MTPDLLEDAIRSGDLERVVELIQAASEPERRAAAPMAQKWQSAAWARHLNHDEKSGVPLPTDDEALDRVNEAACAAVAGTATLSELKKMGWRVWHLGEPAWQLLAQRKPEWLQAWAEWVIAENPRSWKYARALVRDGSITRPTTDAYTTAMIGHLWPNSALEFLRSDPDLLQHEVWRLFEVEGGGEDSLAARDKYSGADYTWSHALTTLSSEGALSRDRLLDESLGALERDFGQFRAGWFSHFHEALAPTVEERAARVDRYLSLLGSRIPPTVSFALKALSLLDKTDRVPGEALVGHVAPALGAREKSTVTLALKLLDRAAKRRPALAGPVAAVACEALMHEKPDVQSAALDLIERHGQADEAALGELLRSRLEDLAPSQRPRAEAWLGAGASSAAVAPAPTPMAAGDVGDLPERAAALPAELRRAAGVDEALAALRGEAAPLPIVDLTPGGFPVLDPAAALTPIATLDELIDVSAAVIENLGPPDEIERMLDGISRLCGERPEDFARRTGPLTKRAQKIATRHQHGDAYLGWIKLDLPELVLAWTTGAVKKRGKSAADMTCFQGHLLWDIARRAAAAKPAQLLAMPTHSGGWLDPRVLVQRVVDLQAQGHKHELFDAIQALLRLAPDHRAEALAAASGLNGELGEALRYALGANGIEIGETAALWVAAARSRAPRSDDAALEKRHPGLGPDAGRTARGTLEAKRRVYKDRGKEYVYFNNTLVVNPPAPKSLDESLPTVMLHAHIELETRDLEIRRWMATVWPAGREAWFAQGVRCLSQNLDWGEADWTIRVHIEALLEPDSALGEMGLTLLALALAAKEAGESGLGTDAAIAALRDGRLSGPALGDEMASLLRLGVLTLTPLEAKKKEKDPKAQPLKPGGVITASRWAKTLAEVARTGPLHADAVHTALQHALAGHPSLRPADLAALLELLHELSVQLSTHVDHPEARAYLESQQGSGKGGTLAKSLLALPPSDQSARRTQVAHLTLESRLERAERWLAMSESS